MAISVENLKLFPPPVYLTTLLK